MASGESLENAGSGLMSAAPARASVGGVGVAAPREHQPDRRTTRSWPQRTQITVTLSPRC